MQIHQCTQGQPRCSPQVPLPGFGQRHPTGNVVLNATAIDNDQNALATQRFSPNDRDTLPRKGMKTIMNGHFITDNVGFCGDLPTGPDPEPGVPHPRNHPQEVARRPACALQPHTHALRDFRPGPALHRNTLKGTRMDQRRNHKETGTLRPVQQSRQTEKGHLGSVRSERLEKNPQQVKITPHPNACPGLLSSDTRVWLLGASTYDRWPSFTARFPPSGMKALEYRECSLAMCGLCASRHDRALRPPCPRSHPGRCRTDHWQHRSQPDTRGQSRSGRSAPTVVSYGAPYATSPIPYRFKMSVNSG